MAQKHLTVDQLVKSTHADVCSRILQQEIINRDGQPDLATLVVDRSSSDGRTLVHTLATPDQERAMGGDRYLTMVVEMPVMRAVVRAMGLTLPNNAEFMTQDNRVKYARVFAVGRPGAAGVSLGGAIVTPPEGGWFAEVPPHNDMDPDVARDMAIQFCDAFPGTKDS
jgi:hypothetical protein